jgi:uncharacterized protein YigE (DUF2233 family)
MLRLPLAPLAALLFVAACEDAPVRACTEQTFEGAAFVVCAFSASDPGLRLVLNHADGAPYAQFDRLAAALASDGETLRFAMNAGMYHEDRRPVGHYVENELEVMRLVTSAGPGNFGMLPNGVFWIDDGRAGITETLAYAARFGEDPPRFASQSGPMLVVGGVLHPGFNADGPSRKRRNGVGISADGTTLSFVISDQPVNFHTFARFFRDALKSSDALFFDGTVSRIYAPELERDEVGTDLGPMVAVIADAGE